MVAQMPYQEEASSTRQSLLSPFNSAKSTFTYKDMVAAGVEYMAYSFIDTSQYLLRGTP